MTSVVSPFLSQQSSVVFFEKIPFQGALALAALAKPFYVKEMTNGLSHSTQQTHREGLVNLSTP